MADLELHCATCGRPAIFQHYCGTTWRRPPAKELAALRQEYETGLSIRALADKYGMSITAIRNRLLWGGTKLRSHTDHFRKH